MHLAFAAPVLLAVVGAQRPTLLVTGATGRLGSELYSQAKALSAFSEVRALVTNLTEARLYLNCSACDASEGICVGDVTDLFTLAPAMAGADAVAIAVGVSGDASADVNGRSSSTASRPSARALRRARRHGALGSAARAVLLDGHHRSVAFADGGRIGAVLEAEQAQLLASTSAPWSSSRAASRPTQAGSASSSPATTTSCSR